MHPSTSPRAYRSLIAFVCLLLASFGFAQSTGGRIVGRVSDPSGAVLNKVKVTLVNQSTGVSREMQTDTNGDYNFVEIPVGTYRVEFELAGFKKNVRPDVILQVNQILTLNTTMTIGEQRSEEHTSELQSQSNIV